MNNKYFRIITSILLSISVYYLFSKSNILSIISLLFSYMSFEIIKKYKCKKLPYILSFIGTVIYILGYSLYYHMTFDYFFTSIKLFIILIISLLSITIVMGNCLYYIFECIKKCNIFNKEESKFNFIKVWILVIIGHLPIYIAYFPGIYAYDIRMQHIEFYGTLTKYHPPLHTFIWILCEKISVILHLSVLTVYSFIQLVLVTLVITFILKFLHKQRVKKSILVISYIMLVINPIVSIFSIITTKDVYFAMSFAFVIMLLYEFTLNEEKFLKNPQRYTLLVIFIILSCLLRNNAVYVFIVLLFVVLIVYKKYYKYMLVIFACPLLIFYTINNPIYHALGIAEGNKREMLSVPIQQIGYVVKHHEKDIDKKTLDNVSKYIRIDDIKNYYNIRFADPMKNGFFTGAYEKDSKTFFKTWFKLFREYPKDYLNAFLELNIPYWFIDAKGVDPYADRVYLEDGLVFDGKAQRYEVRRSSFRSAIKLPVKWKKGYNFYHNFANYKYIKNTPILKTVFSLASPFAFMVFTIFVLIYKKLYKKILVVFLPFMYLMTFMLGPVSNLRYLYPLMILYPIFLLLVFEKRK